MGRLFGRERSGIHLKYRNRHIASPDDQTVFEDVLMLYVEILASMPLEGVWDDLFRRESRARTVVSFAERHR